MNILITDGNYKHSLGILRNIGEYIGKSYVLSNRKFSISGLSKYCKKEIVVPEYDDNLFLEELIKNIKKYKINLIILVGTNSFKYIVPHKNKIEKAGAKFISVDNKKLNQVFSKKETYEIANKLNIPYPKSFYPIKMDDIYDISKKITYPCVIKGLYEVGGNIVRYVYNKEELISEYKSVCSYYSLNEDNGLPLIQEYIEGYGCAFFAVYDNGKCGITFQHKRIREMPPSGGVSVCAESYKNNLVEQYGKIILDYLEWHGVAMVEFKMTEKGIPVLMEINPKFWGSLDLALEAGVNFPLELIKIFKGKMIGKENNFYKYPLRYHWPLDGDIIHMFLNPKASLNILKDIINPNVKSNIWLTDILPIIPMFIYMVGRIIKGILR